MQRRAGGGTRRWWSRRKRRSATDGSSAARRSSVPSASAASRSARRARRCRGRSASELPGSRPAPLVDAQRAAEVEVALGQDRAAAQTELERRRHRLQGDAGAGDQRLQQHVAGTRELPVPPEAGCRPASTSARPVSTLQAMAVSSSCPRRATSPPRSALAPVALLQRRLQLPQFLDVHARLLRMRERCPPWRWARE